MSATVQFIGYVEYEPTHHHAEFIVRGDPRLPDGSQVNWDTLQALNLQPAPFSFPSYWEWTRERFGRALQIRRALNHFGPEGLNRLSPQARTDSSAKGDSNVER